MGKLLDDALIFAVKAHEGQIRKAGRMPYILHPMEVAIIAYSVVQEEEVAAAAILHDVVEDTDVTSAEIRERFGDRVADLVASETEDKMKSKPASETWFERKKKSLTVLTEDCDVGVAAIWLGDKLSNVRSFAAGIAAEGDAFFDRFNQKDKGAHAWYYGEVAKRLVRFRGFPVYEEYVRTVDKIFGEVK